MNLFMPLRHRQTFFCFLTNHFKFLPHTFHRCPNRNESHDSTHCRRDHHVRPSGACSKLGPLLRSERIIPTEINNAVRERVITRGLNPVIANWTSITRWGPLKKKSKRNGSLANLKFTTTCATIDGFPLHGKSIFE